MYENCEALILRRVKYSETSLIVTLFTREFGRVDALAKGARRPKSNLCGHFDFLAHEEITLFRRARSGLDLITAAAGFSDFPQLRQSPARFAAASIIAEIILVACQPHDPHPQLFRSALTAWQTLNNGGEIFATLLNGLSDILTELGFAPRLENCGVCSGEIATRAILSPLGGNLICENCATQKFPPPLPKNYHWLQRGDLAVLRHLREKKSKLKIANGDLYLQTLAHYFSYILARELKSFNLFYAMNL